MLIGSERVKHDSLGFDDVARKFMTQDHFLKKFVVAQLIRRFRDFFFKPRGPSESLQKSGIASFTGPVESTPHLNVLFL